MDIISKKYIFLIISALIVITSVILISTIGFKEGIDLKGGTEWHIQIEDQKVTEEIIKDTIREEAGDPNASVKTAGSNTFIIRLRDTTEEEHQAYLTELKKNFENVEEKSFSSIGPSIGEELKSQAIRAGIFVILGISLYIAWAFRKVSRPVRSWKYGLTALITLFHDVSIPAGLLVVLGITKGIEIDTNFIVALLVVMGFSVHDTIVVFDRIRENLLDPELKKLPLKDVINKSIKETIARSINTSLTLIFVLITLLIWGPGTIFYFILTILIGTIVGTYSSIFIASPLIYLWGGKSP
ncbi:protein translocase subunit SecF [bacterium]|nr:protein translocase subunit SecF [bacterium]|tara:strand:- start:4966 stop:5859 length:894 start_codon:yes stop_codon:yes gene_type:complete